MSIPPPTRRALHGGCLCLSWTPCSASAKSAADPDVLHHVRRAALRQSGVWRVRVDGGGVVILYDPSVTHAEAIREALAAGGLLQAALAAA